MLEEQQKESTEQALKEPTKKPPKTTPLSSAASALSTPMPLHASERPHNASASRLRKLKQKLGFSAMLIIAEAAVPGTAEAQEASAQEEQTTISSVQETLETQRRAKELPDLSDPKVFEDFERIIRARGYVDSRPLSVDPKTWNWPTMEQIRIARIQRDMEVQKIGSSKADIPDSAPTATGADEALLGPPPPETAVKTAEEVAVEDPQIAALRQQLKEAQATIAKFEKAQVTAEAKGGMSSQEKAVWLMIFFGLIVAIGTLIKKIKDNQITGIKKEYQAALVKQGEASQKKIKDELSRLREELGKEAPEMLEAQLTMAKAELKIAQRNDEEKQATLGVLAGTIEGLKEDIRTSGNLLETTLQQLERAIQEKETLQKELDKINVISTRPTSAPPKPSEPESSEDDRETIVSGADIETHNASMKVLDSQANGANEDEQVV